MVSPHLRECHSHAFTSSGSQGLARLQNTSNRHSHKLRAGPDDRPDLITRMVGKIFGKAALEDRKPFGMQRMSEESMQELYPATTTEFAGAVEGDSPEVALFRPLLAKTRLEKKGLRLAYDAEEHGWSPAAFHDRCDGYGAAVVLARSNGGAVLGGFNPQGWIGLSEDRDSNAAFLFTWPDGNTQAAAKKLPKVGGPNLAVMDGRNFGMQFGAEGLTIGLQPSQERQAKSRLGSYYEKLPGRGRSLFAPEEKGKTQLIDLKVFVAEGGPEEWTLDGIVWKSKDGAL